MRNVTLLTVILVLFIITVQPLWAQGIVTPKNTYRLEADEVFGADNVSFTARGNVSLEFKNSVITADEATYFPQSKTLNATGNVTIHDEFQELKADVVTYDLNTETGNIYNATGVLKGEYYICAQKMNKTGKEYYIMEGVRITTCSSPIPEWSFSFYRAEAEIDGYIFGDHATGNIRDFPLIYSPKLFYPLKIDRQTGFLIPSAGYSSEFGTFVRENFFWAISYDKDITIGANAFTERGVHGVIEARYAVSPDSNIYLTADGINDDKSSVNTDGRWRYVSKSLINLPYGIEILADAYKISDYMYMRDFGKMGLYKGIYGDDNSYYQQYHIKWLTPWVEATAMYRANEMYNDTQTGYSYTLTERKPSLSLQKNRLDFELFNVDYLFLWDNVRYLNQYNYFNRQPDEIEYNYSRFFGRASIYRTFRLPLLRFTPRLIETYSHWQDFDYEVDVKLRNTSDFTFLRQSGNGYDRSMPIIELRADVNEIYKIYPDGARHGILNIFQYRFIQGLDQTGLPEYLPYDRFERNNTISWTVRNYLRFKSTWQADLSLTQAVYIDTNESLLPLEIRSNITKPSVFSNIFLLRYDYYAADNITYKSSDRFIALQDTVSLTVNSFILSGIYSYDKINYTEDYNTSLQMNASVTLGNVMVEGGVRWQAANDVLSMSGLEPVENTVSIKWIDQCWGLGFVYTTSKYKKVTPDSRELKREHMVELSLELKGMGESATRVFKSEVDYDN